MGRPKLNVKQISLQVTPETLDRIEALVGRHARSIFIRQAIEKALAEADGESPATFSAAELDLIRQWFNAVEDLSRTYLRPDDYSLATRVAGLCGTPAPRARS